MADPKLECADRPHTHEHRIHKDYNFNRVTRAIIQCQFQCCPNRYNPGVVPLTTRQKEKFEKILPSQVSQIVPTKDEKYSGNATYPPVPPPKPESRVTTPAQPAVPLPSSSKGKEREEPPSPQNNPPAEMSSTATQLVTAFAVNQPEPPEVSHWSALPTEMSAESASMAGRGRSRERSRSATPRRRREDRGEEPESHSRERSRERGHREDSPESPPGGGPPGGGPPGGGPPGGWPNVPGIGFGNQQPGKFKIKEPEVFNGDRTKSKRFLGDLFDLFQSNPEAYRSNTNKVITALSYI